MKKILIILLLAGATLYALDHGTFEPIFSKKPGTVTLNNGTKEVKVLNEESAIIDAIDKTLPSVVTVGIMKTTQTGGSLQIDPSDPFNPFKQTPGQTQKIDQNIGSGFAIAADLVITNKHVVND